MNDLEELAYLEEEFRFGTITIYYDTKRPEFKAMMKSHQCNNYMEF